MLILLFLEPCQELDEKQWGHYKQNDLSLLEA